MNTQESPKIVWITGASRGIGKAIAERFARDGHRLVLSARNDEVLQEVAEPLNGERTLTVECDVREEESVYYAYRRAVERFGRVDVLVNNAGTGVFAPLLELSVQDFDAMIATNLRGTFLCVKAVLPDMVKRKAGAIVNINSISALTSYGHSTGYGASKAGALGLSRSLRQEVRDHNIRVIDVFPGATETDIWDEEEREQYRGRMMQPEDVADMIPPLLAASPRLMVEEIVLRPQRGDL